MIFSFTDLSQPNGLRSIDWNFWIVQSAVKSDSCTSCGRSIHVAGIDAIRLSRRTDLNRSSFVQKDVFCLQTNLGPFGDLKGENTKKKESP